MALSAAHCRIGVCFVAIAIVAVTASCNPHQASRSSSTKTHVVIDAPVEATVLEHGIEIKIEQSVHYHQETHRGVTTVDGENRRQESSSCTINGYTFGVEDGRLRIGPRKFGVVKSGDKVRIAAAGVFVNGQRRGDVPAAR